MIIMTISNWRKKLKIALAVIFFLLLGGILWMFLGMGEEKEVGAENDRDANGSLKVEASPGEALEVDSSWWGELVETLKAYYQD